MPCLTKVSVATCLWLCVCSAKGCEFLNYRPYHNHSMVVHVDSDPWASYQISKIVGCACAGNAGNVFPRRRFQRKPLISDPGMHHGTCVTHVPWCMSGSLTCGYGENVPGIPGACAPAILRIWQEAHVREISTVVDSSVSAIQNVGPSWTRNMMVWRLSAVKPQDFCIRLQCMSFAEMYEYKVTFAP